ncbi:hypothetical protein C8J57DRAFT_122269 [Mycena rebaudengoi]|nr:hypothetical protein C8J57DRAFT_122269 [Mycena rebaudengoi]
MVKFATSFAALAATFVTALAASETLAQSLTKDATFLAYDEAGWTIAYDGNFTELARYHTPASASVTSLAPISPRAGRCSSLTTSQLKTLAAWPIMEKKARELWGSGSYNLVTNPSEYPGNPATVCVTDNIVKMTLSGNPYCSTSSASTGGTIVGTSGTVTLTFKSSYGSTNSYSVSRTSSLALGVKASASFGIPGIGNGSVETSVEATFTNSIGSSFETKTDSAVEHSITLNAAPDSVCKLDYSIETCYQSSKGEVPFIATGWVWFNYNTQTHGHYKWALNLAGYTVESQRSSYTHFTGGINSHSTGNYHGKCT